MIRYLRIPLACLLLSLLTADLRAERKYVIGTKVDFVAGGSTFASVSSIESERLPTGFSAFSGSYPTIELKTTGKNSVLDLSYTFGLYRLKSDLAVDSESHAVGANFNTRLGERWKLKLSESFEVAPDFTNINVFRAVISTPQGFDFAFDPMLQRRSSASHRVNGNLDYELNPKSNLSLGLSHSLRDYAEDPAFQGRLSDQNRIAANIGFNRKLGRHGGWNLKYAVFRNEFRDFEDAVTHDASIGYSHQLTPTVSLSLDLGPSYTKSLRFHRSYAGYNVSLSLQKLIRSNRVSLYYEHRNGDSTGLGSVSDTHNARFGVVLPIRRRTTLTLDLSAYDSRGRLGNDLQNRGGAGSVDLAFAFTDRWSLSGGASYQKQVGASLAGAEHHRVFVALRFHAPELWRFAR